MGPTGAALGRVNNDGVWRITRVALLAAALIFLVTIVLGFVNVLTTGDLPRWQLLVHLHSGTMGWLMLGTIGVGIWLFTGQRNVSPEYVSRARTIVWAAIVSFVLLVVSFGLAYSMGGHTWYLLAIAAPLAALVVWAAAAFVLARFSELAIATTAHWLISGGLVAAGIATTMGTLVALSRAEVLGLPFELAIVTHIFAIEGFLFLVGAGIIEWITGDDAARGVWGILQTLVGLLIGFLGPIVLVIAIAGLPAEPLQLVLLAAIVVFGLLFFIRVGYRAIQANPLASGAPAWAFFATIWLVVAVILWPLRIGLGGPAWWIPVYAHAIFLGVLSNGLLGVLSARAGGLPAAYELVEPVAMWVMNLGMVLFFATLIAMGTTHGAWVMGAGVLAAVLAMILSLYQAPERGASRPSAI